MINRRARPDAYRSKRDYVAADFASRTMRWTGIIVAAVRDLPPARPDVGAGEPGLRRAATRTTTSSRRFERVPVALVYVVANLALGVHLYHGAWSLFQSMGWVRPWRRQFATVFAAVDRARQRLLPAGRHVRGGQLSLDARVDDPAGLDPARRGTTTASRSGWSTRPTSGASRSSSSAPAWRARSAAATLAELGYEVEVFTFHDSPRRAHSIAAQGGINAAKDYRNDGDSIFRLFYDTIKGGDFRSREANVYRLAQVSNEIIDQATAQGVPFAREYGGLLDNRSFGGAQVSRTFYARGQTGQQLLLGAYQAMMRQVAAGKVKLHTRTEMLDVVVARGQRARDHHARPADAARSSRTRAHAVVLATGGYSNAFFLSTNAKASNATAIWRAHKRGAAFANPCFTQIHPTCIPQSDDTQSKLTLMSESLRNDGRIWVPLKVGDDRAPGTIPEDERDYFLERRYPAFGNLVPRDVASRAAKGMIDEDRGVGPRRNGVYLDFADAISRLGMDVIRARYGNLFQMYERITGEDPYEVPMRIYPAPHYTMGGLWVDYDLMTTVPGLYAIGEANFSDHGANRLGASALMQGLADGYFILPVTIGDYLAPLLGPRAAATPTTTRSWPPRRRSASASRTTCAREGEHSVDWFHRELGKVLWEACGMARNGPGLEHAMAEIAALHERFKAGVKVLGDDETLNQSLEKAGRVDDFFEVAQLMCRDALHREESCGGHFREEHQTPDGEALRDDDNFAYVAAWEYTGGEPILHKEHAHLPARAAVAAELRMRLTLRIWRQAGPVGAGRLRDLRGRRRHATRCRSSSCSTLLNERLDRRGPRAGRVRVRLPRGHLRLVRADDRRPGARPAARHGDLPAAHAAASPTATRSPSSPCALGRLPDHQGPRRRPRARSTASSRPAASSPRRPAARPTRT